MKFIGAPDASNPESPTNDPDYIKALSTCAARSGIVQTLQAAQAEQDTLTPAQIKERNKGYLAWRDCMIKRGWGIPKPTPDSKGRLFRVRHRGRRTAAEAARGQGPVQQQGHRAVLGEGAARTQRRG